MDWMKVVVMFIGPFVFVAISFSLALTTLRNGFQNKDVAIAAIVFGILVLVMSTIRVAVALATYLASLIK